MSDYNIINSVNESREKLKSLVIKTPIEKLRDNIYIKREDKQIVRSFKIRGAFNKINNSINKENGVVCASAGNHAQGFAITCNHLNIFGDIFIPTVTPPQKINRIAYFASPNCNIHKIGNNFDECLKHALEFSKNNKKTFIHPYDDIDTIIGQGTIAAEILEDMPNVTTIVVPIGGGGLIAGISAYIKNIRPDIEIIGVEPETCPSMKTSIKNDEITTIETSDTFVDGATVKKVGNLTFEICRKYVDDIVLINNGHLSCEMLKLVNDYGIVAEPAGALSIASLSLLNLENKNIVCILSGGNHDVSRYPDIIDRAIKFRNKRHYYLVKFAQRPKRLEDYVTKILGPNDNIICIKYVQKETFTEFENVLFGFEVINLNSINDIEKNMIKYEFDFKKIQNDDPLLRLIL